jgi:hypothetical protein
MTLQAEEFIRRFLLHVLPEGFQRVRYYGFLANRYREISTLPRTVGHAGTRTSGFRSRQGLFRAL